MDRLLQSVRTLVGFFWWTVSFPPSLIIFASCGFVLALSYRRIDPHLRRDLWRLMVLPVGWIFAGLWGGWFWMHWEQGAPANPAWVEQALLGPLAFTAFLAVYLVWLLKGARWFSAAFAVMNMYLTIAMVFFASMAVSGTWL